MYNENLLAFGNFCLNPCISRPASATSQKQEGFSVCPECQLGE